MTLNYGIFQTLYMYMARLRGGDLFLSIVATILFIPCFGWTDAAPFEIRADLSLYGYGFFTMYYTYWFCSFFVFKDVFGEDDVLTLGGIEVTLSSMACSANANLVIFMTRYWWNIYQNRDSFVIWREQVKIFDEKCLEFLQEDDVDLSQESILSESKFVYMTEGECKAFRRSSMARVKAITWIDET